MSEPTSEPVLDERGACVFCEIVAGRAPAEVVARGENDIIIVPLNPVVPGHVIVIPHIHVTDVTDDPMVSGACVRAAAWFTKNRGPKTFNLITSVGAAATQTVMHLHIHIIPRSEGDGLGLPWTATGDALTEALRERDALIDQRDYANDEVTDPWLAGIIRGLEWRNCEAEHRAEQYREALEGARPWVKLCIGMVYGETQANALKARDAIDAALAALDTTAGPGGTQ